MLEKENLDLSSTENTYKRLIKLNKHVENLLRLNQK